MQLRWTKRTIKSSLGENNVYYKQWRRQAELNKLKVKEKVHPQCNMNFNLI